MPSRGLDRAALRGFTLLELVVVLVLLGTLAALVYPRITGTSAFASASFLDQVATGLRYAQRFAVATGCEVEVQVDSGSERLALRRRSGGSDSACGDGAFELALGLPGQAGDYVVAAPDGVDVTSGIDLYFDAEGVPRPGGGSVVVDGRSLVIEPGSGHVH